MAKKSAESRSDYLGIYGAAMVATLAGFLIAYQFVEPAPPSEITMSTGSPDGAYHGFAKRYAALLARDGITLTLLPSAGSVENLQHLTDETGGADIALVQGGVSSGEPAEGLHALGSLYYEPLWVFYRSDTELKTLVDMQGRRIAVGADGSGTQPVMARLLGANGVTAENTELLPLGGSKAAQALLDGDIEVAAFISSPLAKPVQRLLREPSVRLMSFARAEAYARLHPYLNRVSLPRGAISLADDLPAGDVQLLAPAATLVARDSLHPALAVLLLQTASRLHSDGSLFERPAEFPSSRFVEFPLSDEAQRYYRSGPPFLQRYLPFWAANLADRMKVLLVPLITVLLPLFKIVPPFYSWRIRRRIYKWYREVREIEIDYLSAPSPEARQSGLSELARIERELVGLKVPLGVADALYHLRLHIRFVRDELNEVE